MHVLGRSTVQFSQVRSIGHQSARLGELAPFIHCRQTVLGREPSDLLACTVQPGVRQDEQGIGAFPLHGRKDCGQFGQLVHHHQLQIDPKPPARWLRVAPEILIVRISRVAEYGDACDGRYGFLKQFQPLAAELRSVDCDAGDVPAGPGEAGDCAGSHRITRPSHDNRNRAAGSFRRHCGWCREGNDRVGAKAHQLGRQLVERLGLAFREAVFYLEIPSLSVAELTEAVFESCYQMRNLAGREIAEARHFC
jgi:hypothetical protein